jgi:RND family efflux transporter MFP subunit
MTIRNRFRCRASAVLLVGLLAAGCTRHAGQPAAPPAKVNLRRGVELTVAEQRSLDYFVEAVGVLEAEGQTDIAAGVAGVVDEVLFREGDEVTPDTILVKVDQKRYVAAADVTRANEQQAQADLNRARAAVALAKDQADRAREARHGVSEEERTQKALAFRVAEAELKAAEAKLLAAQAAQTVAENNLNRSRVRPPYGGRINQRRVTVGSFVEDKTAVATIADLSRLRLVGFVPETAAATVRARMTARQMTEAAPLLSPAAACLAARGSPFTLMADFALASAGPGRYDAEFSTPAYPQKTFRAKLFYLSTVANPETHMFECKAEVPTRSEGVTLQPGFTARVRYPLRTNPDACVVPEESVRPNERGFVAFVPVQKKSRSGSMEWVAEARVLELGYRAPGWVEVRKGLRPGEPVVRRGSEALEDGTPIQFPNDDVGKRLTSTRPPENGGPASGGN